MSLEMIDTKNVIKDPMLYNRDEVTKLFLKLHMEREIFLAYLLDN